MDNHFGSGVAVPYGAMIGGMTDNVSVADAPDRKRYEATVDGRVAGYAEYLATGALTVFTHTEVEPAYEGRGVGGALARFALDDMRARGRQVLPVCPFINRWIGRHPEYADLIYQSESKVTD